MCHGVLISTHCEEGYSCSFLHVEIFYLLGVWPMKVSSLDLSLLFMLLFTGTLKQKIIMVQCLKGATNGNF